MPPTQINYDLFVSHASEDKDRFVRPLVEQLAEAGLTVWFDEATLKVGDSLVGSIEAGLSQSRFGIVVLSPAFFARGWPRRELDALTNRELATGESVLMPIWLDVDADAVREYSILLADRYAIIGSRGVEYAASAITERVRPGGSPIAIARDLLADRGVATPPPSDPWWLEVVESSAEPDYIDIHSGLLRWGFPLPPDDGDATSRGRRIAQAALRDAWMAEAERRPVTQITEPEVVHEFIREMPGLFDTCMEHPRYLGAYAPQLLIPGFGGPFEQRFDDWLESEQAGGSLDTVGWHLVAYGEQDAAQLACCFVQGELTGPAVKFYEETIDYFFWALSASSSWLPAQARGTLVRGFRDWGAWTPSGMRGDDNTSVAFLTALGLSETPSPEPLDLERIRALLITIARDSAEVLGLPDDPAVLADRLLATGAVQERHGRWSRRESGSNNSQAG